MQIKATAKFVHVSPEKLAMVARTVMKLPVEKALNQLKLSNRKSARLLTQVVASALANAKNTHNTNDNLVVQSVVVLKGPSMKRFRAAARGVAHKYKRRTSHVTVTLIQRVKQKAKSITRVKKEKTK